MANVGITQVSDETGCGLGCLLIALTFPVSAVSASRTEGIGSMTDLAKSM